MTNTDALALVSAWQRFSAWLAAHSPADHAALRPPADAGRIAHLEEGLGFALHPQLRALLELHDGVAQPPDGEMYPPGSFLPLGHRLIPTEHILTRHREFAEVLPPETFGPESWRHLVSHAHWWVPIALPNDGGLLLVDHLPGPVYGHVYEMGLGSGDADGSLWATSLADMFTALTDSLTTGRQFHHFAPDTHRHAPGHHRIDWQVVL
ncbi:SMI1/KNR4 family protein [Kitasatospora sp. MY 5-36]|uniref:SMI1/KNR4 family protein n=1 Tax=unclassified Kitasatospora TaxID=2633591 RepID=UPI00067168FB|nr:SMI1/KNR4 family protein [Kitasatospora sp. MY 5-36]